MTTTRLTDTITDANPSIANTQEFHTMLENHVLLLIRSSGSQVLSVENGQALQYDSDFFGLLNTLLVPPKYHWVTMRCNGMYSPNDYKSSVTSVILPNFDEIDALEGMFNSSSSLAIG
jgi:hypothetical protein